MAQLDLDERSGHTAPLEVLDQVRSLGLSRPDGRLTTRRFLGHITLYGGAGAAAESLGHPVIWALTWAVQALLLLGGLAASHEAIHNNLFRSRTANRRAGMLAAGAAGVPWSAYRAYHLAHHADTRGPADPEPDERVDGPLLWLLAMALGGSAFLVQTWAAVARAVVGRPPSWARHAIHRRALRRSAAVAVVPAALLVTALVAAPVAAPAIVIRWWLVPLALVWAGLASFVVIPEHHGLGLALHAFDSTRTTRSNRLFRWMFWNNNLHTAHHLVPSVPWHQLGVLHAAIEPRCAHVASGYLSYHLGLVRRRP